MRGKWLQFVRLLWKLAFPAGGGDLLQLQIEMLLVHRMESPLGSGGRCEEPSQANPVCVRQVEALCRHVTRRASSLLSLLSLQWSDATTAKLAYLGWAS